MPKPHNSHPHPPAGQRFLCWLGFAAEKVRTDADVRIEQIATMVDLSGAQIRRFEKAKHFPNDPDRMLAAYAAAAGLDDPRAIYQQALDLWYEHGSKPLLSAKTDGATTPGAARNPVAELRAKAERLPRVHQDQTKRQAQRTEATTDDQSQHRQRKRA